MDIVVKGRHTAVPERFREHAEAKIAKLERFDHKAFRVDAELSREHNPRMADVRERVELTVFSRGPVIRAEAAAADPYAALDLAAAKLAERLRRAADRRIRHNGAGRGSLAQPSESVVAPQAGLPGGRADAGDADASAAAGGDADYGVPDSSPFVVREKIHRAAPMTLDDALSNMELVGHDFYLFCDVRTGLPSVVYRRCGYDYGLIRLEADEGQDPDGGSAVHA
ncbi:ribosome hibernation-promoting factor, HPF/YfiA family [Candidatus Protofrankia californiensis]|uniref:ribosome hibernation-promoting factor, HPF/YfiA family n=1 Tax=Candidatus Protofrankia californiensis TaxID=1839754 RepID=UPI0013EC1F4D|nr:ribosome-associated translation inhibitor RaiA [Candidatus Protofrankia californiensis]